jgi:uncharacterized membrane protein
MTQLRSLWLATRDSLWFVPTLLVLAGVVAALVLIELQPMLERDLSQDWPRLFGAGAEGARAMLAAIATSMITVAGVVFSVTIVALSLTASQYSPRALRNFMGDRPTQVVLGAFVSVFAYCLIVLRTIRGADEGAFVPSMAVLGGVFMAFVGVGLLIYFVHHVAMAIQVASIVQRIASDTAHSIERLFPQGVGQPQDEAPTCEQAAVPGGPWQDIAARDTGYLVAIDAQGLLEFAATHDTVVRVRPQVGDFVIDGTTVIEVAPIGGTGQISDKSRTSLLACMAVDNERNVEQDAAYGLQQLVDVALKALSPSVHDPHTAVTCIDHLGALLHRLSQRHIEGPLRRRDGRLRLVLAAPGYDDLVAAALASITHHAGGHPVVHERLIAAVACAAGATDDRERVDVLLRQLATHRQRLASCDLPEQHSRRLRRQIGVLSDRLTRQASRRREAMRLQPSHPAPAR